MANCCSLAFTKFSLFGRSTHVLKRLQLTPTYRKFAAIKTENYSLSFQKRLISNSVAFSQISKKIQEKRNNDKMSEYTIIEKGAPNSTNYSVYLSKYNNNIYILSIYYYKQLPFAYLSNFVLHRTII